MAVQIKTAVPAERVAADLSAVRQTVQDVLGDVRARDDAAVREYSEKFDGWSPDSFRLSEAQVEDIVTGDLDEAYALADEFASEHVEVLTAVPREALTKMTDYGALFLGAGTCVSYGDKVIGTNHVLPTRKAARYTGGLWVGKYLKTVTYQEVTDPVSSAEPGRVCGRASRVESFEGHARSGDIRAAALDGAAPAWLTEALAR